MDLITLAAAKGYVGETADSLGAVKGAPATIKSITEIDGGHRVTFEWTGTSGTKQTSTLDVMNGVNGTDGKDGKNGAKGAKGDPGQNGQDGIGISKIEKTKTEGLIDTYVITFSDNSTFEYTVTNGKDGKDGTGSSTGEENVIESIKVNGVAQTVAEDKSVDIIVPTVDVDKNYVDTELAKKANTSDIPSLDKYVTDEELTAKGYLTSHQDISGKVDKVKGKSLIADTEIERLKSVKNYDDTDIKTELAKKANSTDVTKEISDKIAEVVSDAPESFDTLKEISDWISGHENDASAMNSAIKDNKSAIATLQTDKANKTEIPTSLPANGGNADTVGGHTVKSDVPENAVFTDTVYDYSALLGYDIYNLVSLKDTTYPANKGWLSKDFVAPFDGFVFFMVQTDGTSGAFSQILKEDDVLVSNNQKNIADFNTWGEAYRHQISKGKTYHFGSYTNVATAFNKVMLCIRKKLETPTEYIPYAPSNVALAEEASQQSTEMMDIKMLGWSVPRECPIQNEVNGNQFVQKVGRVDMSKLAWYTYSSTGIFRFASGMGTEYTKYNIKRGSFAYSRGYKYVGISGSWSDISNYGNKTIMGVFAGGGDDGFILTNNSYTDSTAFKQAMQGQYLYYELATPITTTIDGNEIGETVSDVRKETTVNLLNPTLQTTTQNGVTCTNNGDGTYTLNGTASSDTTFVLKNTANIVEENANKTIRFVAKGDTLETYYTQIYFNNTTPAKDLGSGISFKVPTNVSETNLAVLIKSSAVLSNILIKPMITTNLDTTYDDFVPYTGDTGSLNGDVADLRDDVEGLKNETKAAINDTSTTSTTETWSAKKINDSIVDTFSTRVILSLSRGVDVSTQSATLNGADGAYLYWSSMAGQDKYTIGIILYVNSGWSIIPLKESDQKTTINLSVSANTLTMTRSSSGFPCAGGVIALGTGI